MPVVQFEYSEASKNWSIFGEWQQKFKAGAILKRQSGSTDPIREQRPNRFILGINLLIHNLTTRHEHRNYWLQLVLAYTHEYHVEYPVLG